MNQFTTKYLGINRYTTQLNNYDLLTLNIIMILRSITYSKIMDIHLQNVHRPRTVWSVSRALLQIDRDGIAALTTTYSVMDSQTAQVVRMKTARPACFIKRYSFFLLIYFLITIPNLCTYLHQVLTIIFDTNRRKHIWMSQPTRYCDGRADARCPFLDPDPKCSNIPLVLYGQNELRYK